MVPKVALIVLFCISVSFAVILSLVPNLTALWISTRQLVDFSFSEVSVTKNQNKIHHLCSRSFPVIGIQPELLKNEIDEQSAIPRLLSESPVSKTRLADLDGEAVSALHLAKEMLANRKMDKASKLFLHAMALSPRHPDILTEYGEFLELYNKDIVSAEHMYCRALVNNPGHSKALVNRKRTQPLVEEIDQSHFNVIDQKVKLLMGIPENHPGIKRMMQESYFRHIYHTTAIEGNTFTLAQTRMLVENRLAIGGKSVMEHNEILGMDSAFTFVNNSLMHRLGSLTSMDIRNIHRRVLGHVDPVGAGELRTTQVFVGDYEPPDPTLMPQMMEEFMEWLNSEEALSLHPIELSALAHYKLVWIHPFYDGNGRTSRLLMNLILMQAGYPPVIIKVEEKHLYYQHLQTANDGDVRPFIRYIAKCTDRSIDEYLLAGLENAKALISTFQQLQDDGRTIIMEEVNDERTP